MSKYDTSLFHPVPLRLVAIYAAVPWKWQPNGIRGTPASDSSLWIELGRSGAPGQYSVLSNIRYGSYRNLLSPNYGSGTSVSSNAPTTCVLDPMSAGSLQANTHFHAAYAPAQLPCNTAQKNRIWNEVVWSKFIKAMMATPPASCSKSLTDGPHREQRHAPCIHHQYQSLGPQQSPTGEHRQVSSCLRHTRGVNCKYVVNRAAWRLCLNTPEHVY